jgi:hypothetical protein
MLGTTVANRIKVVGKLIATVAKRTPRQDGARRTEWRTGQRLDLGRSFNARHIGRSLIFTRHRRMPPPLRRLITARWPSV